VRSIQKNDQVNAVSLQEVFRTIAVRGLVPFSNQEKRESIIPNATAPTHAKAAAVCKTIQVLLFYFYFFFSFVCIVSLVLASANFKRKQEVGTRPVST
jgi:hypothetical protein